MKELFEKRTLYRKMVVDHVQSELTQFGLHIYNASIKELRDLPGSHYFEFQSKKAHEGYVFEDTGSMSQLDSECRYQQYRSAEYYLIHQAAI
jgi:hypothetical protein